MTHNYGRSILQQKSPDVQQQRADVQKQRADAQQQRSNDTVPSKPPNIKEQRLQHASYRDKSSHLTKSQQKMIKRLRRQRFPKESLEKLFKS